MANVHRREVLLGFVAGAVGAPLAGAPSAAAERTEPPGDGPLSVKEVGSLLGQHKVPGASLAIIQNGEIVATYGYGVAQPNRPVTPRTRFQAASISKTFNALAVLKLVEASEFRLDDPVNQRLQSWKLPDNALTAATPVTIRMLLNHTGGTNTPGFVGYRPGAPLPTLIEILNGSPPANSSPIRVEWPPGQDFRYSGGGIMVLEASGVHIFVSERGAPLSVAGYQRMVARAGERFPFLIHSHMLRHSCGYKLANDGHDTRAIQHYLGHRSIASTVRYTTMSPHRFRGFWKD